jgi:hypothetical protein
MVIYSWILIIKLSVTGVPIYTRHFHEPRLCESVAALYEYKYDKLITHSCVPVYKSQGGNWKRAFEIHNSI